MSIKHVQCDFSLIEGGAELLNRVGPLWSQWRLHHAVLSPVWSEIQLATSFEKWRTKLLTTAARGPLVLLASSQSNDVGYCVGAIDNTVGEVDSIFVIPAYRRHGIGHAMMSRTMEWFLENVVTSRVVDTFDGNGAAQEFYARYGFRPDTARLLRTND